MRPTNLDAQPTLHLAVYQSGGLPETGGGFDTGLYGGGAVPMAGGGRLLDKARVGPPWRWNNGGGGGQCPNGLRRIGRAGFGDISTGPFQNPPAGPVGDSQWNGTGGRGVTLFGGGGGDGGAYGHGVVGQKTPGVWGGWA